MGISGIDLLETAYGIGFPVMSMEDSNALEFIELLRRIDPGYVDLLSARSESDFDAAFDALLEKAVDHLERNSKNFKSVDENGLTAVLVGVLRIPGIDVLQEANSNGHVDITITVDHSFPTLRKLGEAKIYRGARYHRGGVGQLIRRYSTGRESRGLLIVYVKQKDIADCIRKIREDMDSVLPHGQTTLTRDHVIKFSFLSSHNHSSGVEIDVEHVGCNLYH